MSDGARKSMGRNVRALVGVADIPLAVLGGFALFFLTSYLCLAWAGIMPVSLRRIANVGPFLQKKAGESQEKNIFLFGSSVLVEGIDCDVLDGQLPPGHKSFNLGWTGTSLREVMLAVPAAVRAHPATVVFCVLPSDLFITSTIPAERAAMTAWSGMTQAEDIADLNAVLKTEETKPLSDSMFTHLLRFRALPLGALNAHLNEVARSDLRYDGYTTNFRSPWVMRKRVNSVALDRHLAGYIESFDKVDMTKLAPSLDECSLALVWNLRRLRESNCKAAVVMAPQHPVLLAHLKKKGLWDASLAMLKKTCQEGNALLLDHSELISAEDFADAVHPREPGRLLWSHALGQALAGQIQ